MNGGKYYDLREETVQEKLSSHNDDIHRRLYNVALKRYASSKSIDLSKFRLVEVISSSDYRKPSKVQLISRVRNYESQLVDLTPWWPSLPDVDTRKPLYDYDYNLTELVSKNYVTGKATVIDRYNTRTMDMPLKHVPDGIKKFQGLQDGLFSEKLKDTPTEVSYS